jgi:regulator of ribosome biosynthesis
MSDVEMSEAPEPISPSDQLVKEATLAHSLPARSDVVVTKPIPYTFDIGNLLLNDANPVPSHPTPASLLATGRDCAQALINQLLTVCPISSNDDGVYITLPTPSTPLPREKSIPKEKEPTKWERFAAKKGIKAKRREGKLVFDETSGEWVPRYGFKGANKTGENDWLVEVDADKEKRTGEAGDARKEKRVERMERIRRQERKMRANEKRGKLSSSG